MTRGNRGERIYLDDIDRHDFIKRLAEACQKTGWQVHAYCLMRNHYHLVLETPNANLVAGMAWLQSTYTIGLNHRQQDTPQGRERFERLMGARRLEETDEAALKVFRRGWCLGSPRIREQRLQQSEGKLGEHRSGGLRRETAEAKAERLVEEELRSLGWTQEDLATHRKSDPGKLAIAAGLRRETTLSIKAIAARVQLGASKGANSNLHRWMRANAREHSAQGQLGI